MNLLKKAAISLAVTSMIAAPVVASAAPAISAVSFGDVSAVSAVDGQSEIEGSTLIVALLALAAIIGGAVLAGGNNSDTPTSP